MSETSYNRVDKLVIKKGKTTIFYTDYRNQDMAKDDGRYEMDKRVGIPGDLPRSFATALKKLIPHLLACCHLGESEAAKKSTELKSIEFKGEHRDTLVVEMIVEDTNLKPFKISGLSLYVHDAERTKAFKNAVSDLQAEIDTYLGEKDLPVQLKIDFSAAPAKN